MWHFKIALKLIQKWYTLKKKGQFHNFWELYKSGLRIFVCFNLHDLQTDEDPAHGFSQAFVLKPANASWFIAHDVFRLAIHDVAASV